jgi:hypothetical protein
MYINYHYVHDAFKTKKEKKQVEVVNKVHVVITKIIHL